MKTVKNFKQKIKAISHIPTRWSMDPPSDPYEKHLAMARVLQIKRVACIETIASCTSMVTLKSSLTAILGETRARIQKIWTRLSSKISQKARS
jgi:hypothetical protein